MRVQGCQYAVYIDSDSESDFEPEKKERFHRRHQRVLDKAPHIESDKKGRRISLHIAVLDSIFKFLFSDDRRFVDEYTTLRADRLRRHSAAFHKVHTTSIY